MLPIMSSFVDGPVLILKLSQLEGILTVPVTPFPFGELSTYAAFAFTVNFLDAYTVLPETSAATTFIV